MKQLLFSLNKNDFEITFIKCSGPGGQKVNKTSSGCRILHPPSGAVSESTTHRSQKDNKKSAFEKLVKSDKFNKWLKIEICKKSGQLDEIEKIVDQEMSSENIKTEVIDEHGKWTSVSKDHFKIICGNDPHANIH